LRLSTCVDGSMMRGYSVDLVMMIEFSAERSSPGSPCAFHSRRSVENSQSQSDSRLSQQIERQADFREFEQTFENLTGLCTHHSHEAEVWEFEVLAPEARHLQTRVLRHNAEVRNET
jgi:hypothetical protein